MANQLKTILLLGALSVLIVTLGGLIGGAFLWVAIVLAVALNVGSFFYSDRLVLRMSRARVVDQSEAPALYGLVRELAERADLPMPRVAVVPDATPNAFATGRSPERAVVAVTEGLLHLTDRRQLRGVLAHELAHVKNRDTLIASIAAAGATAITIVGNTLQWTAMFGGVGGDDDEGGSPLGALLLGILAPIGATLIQMGISRSREYAADEYAARLTGDPQGLADALARLQDHGRQLLQRGAAAPQPATMSLSIVNPLAGLRGRGADLANLFSTHPPIEERIRRLLAMSGSIPRSA